MSLVFCPTCGNLLHGECCAPLLPDLQGPSASDVMKYGTSYSIGIELMVLSRLGVVWRGEGSVRAALPSTGCSVSSRLFLPRSVEACLSGNSLSCKTCPYIYVLDREVHAACVL